MQITGNPFVAFGTNSPRPRWKVMRSAAKRIRVSNPPHRQKPLQVVSPPSVQVMQGPRNGIPGWQKAIGLAASLCLLGITVTSTGWGSWSNSPQSGRQGTTGKPFTGLPMPIPTKPQMVMQSKTFTADSRVKPGFYYVTYDPSSSTPILSAPVEITLGSTKPAGQGYIVFSPNGNFVTSGGDLGGNTTIPRPTVVNLRVKKQIRLDVKKNVVTLPPNAWAILEAVPIHPPVMP